MVSGLAPIQPVGSTARASAADVQKRAAWCMIRAKWRGLQFIEEEATPFARSYAERPRLD
jgi:hypothetical protein